MHYKFSEETILNKTNMDSLENNDSIALDGFKFEIYNGFNSSSEVIENASEYWKDMDIIFNIVEFREYLRKSMSNLDSLCENIFCISYKNIPKFIKISEQDFITNVTDVAYRCERYVIFDGEGEFILKKIKKLKLVPNNLKNYNYEFEFQENFKEIKRKLRIYITALILEGNEVVSMHDLPFYYPSVYSFGGFVFCLSIVVKELNLEMEYSKEKYGFEINLSDGKKPMRFCFSTLKKNVFFKLNLLKKEIEVNGGKYEHNGIRFYEVYPFNLACLSILDKFNIAGHVMEYIREHPICNHATFDFGEQDLIMKPVFFKKKIKN